MTVILNPIPNTPSAPIAGAPLTLDPGAAPAAIAPPAAPQTGAAPAASAAATQTGITMNPPLTPSYPVAGVAPNGATSRVPADLQPVLSAAVAEQEAIIRSQVRREIETARGEAARLAAENNTLRQQNLTLEQRVTRIEQSGLTPDQIRDSEIQNLKAQITSLKQTHDAMMQQAAANAAAQQAREQQMQLEAHRASRLAQYAASIEPELHAQVGGRTFEEVDSSVVAAIHASTALRNRFRTLAPVPAPMVTASPATAAALSRLYPQPSQNGAPQVLAPMSRTLIPGVPPSGVPIPGETAADAIEQVGAQVRDARTFEGMRDGRYAGVREAALGALRGGRPA